MRSSRASAVLAAGACALYYTVLRRPILTWGATDQEAASRLPGDDLLEDADGVSTRAIEIDAPASAVWPWLAQMGPSPRGGAYTYDWIENLLGLNMHSVDRVLREFQHPEIGETIDLGANRMRLERVEPEHVIAWRSEDGNWVWTFVLTEDHGKTRLISRNRFRLPTIVARIGMLPMEPGSLVMERKMLLEIRKRAEQRVSSNAALTAIRVIHTLTWLSIESCMLYVLYAGFTRRSDRRTAIAAGVVAGESLLFAANRFRCPLTQVAERLGAKRGSVTDIYLPRWFAHNLPAIHVPLIVLAAYLHGRNLR